MGEFRHTHRQKFMGSGQLDGIRDDRGLSIAPTHVQQIRGGYRQIGSSQKKKGGGAASSQQESSNFQKDNRIGWQSWRERAGA